MAALLWALWACVAEPEPVVDPRPQVTVVAGDTLGAIAKAHGVTVDALRAANGIDGDRIEVGQVLRIPLPTEAPAVKASRRASKQSAKACLPPPAGVDGEAGMAASEGLSEAQVAQALDAASASLAACAPPGRSGRVELVVVVACDGTVASVDAPGAPEADRDVVACFAERLRAAPFPAHDLPDGERFVYPLSWEGPG